MGTDILSATKDPHTFKAKAKALSLGQILDEYWAPGVIDMLSVDAGVAELEVWKGVDLSKYRYRLMMVEASAHLALSQLL